MKYFLKIQNRRNIRNFSFWSYQDRILRRKGLKKKVRHDSEEEERRKLRAEINRLIYEGRYQSSAFLLLEHLLLIMNSSLPLLPHCYKEMNWV